MPRKVLLIADPGIDTAFAVALALNDPNLEVVGLLPTAGNVSAEQATANVHTLIDVLDPPKWPKLGAALPVRYETDGTALHGPGGLGGVTFPSATRHTLHPADKILCELAHEYPRQITVINLGPLTTLATALDRDPVLPALLDQTVVIGGCWRESGNAGPVAEFHMHLDPDAAKRVFAAELNPLLITLDSTRRLIFSPRDLLNLPNPDSRTCQFLRQIVPFGIRASSNLYGIEGFHLKDVLGTVAVAVAGCVSSESHYVDVETRGELTRGMTVIDTRPSPASAPNARVATSVAVDEVREYIERTLKAAH
ncbi:nucleoside hydrolase [Gemmata sp. G18]|uniref:Nucleoside hydrolase n=1 Tax=Gemmata palustris TaxID=2822762 RepID=A0ABS5BQB6_9BACT|nr:nucleoside hydrolase [Gemmata palustris]MBP3955934.1 nucleoside hydrolase [Gemmata palustris]